MLRAASSRIADYFRVSILAAVAIALTLSTWFGSVDPAIASLTDDRFDGNIFALYAGNGSLVPPRVTLADSLKREKPAILFFYVDDSADCKKFSGTVSQLQAFYGKAADFIPVIVDALPPEGSNDFTTPAFYYRGLIPQTVVIDGSGKVILDEVGQVPFETVDDRLREVFDLLPRSESVELRRRTLNEVNIEVEQVKK
ncbi:MAG: thylakoid membrane photosystem I accumulation factor [Cyanobacteria bacterium P01_D01_bin.73]